MREPGLSDVFRRDLDRLEVPVEAVWVPALRRRSPIRSLLAAAGAAALVVAAVTGGLAVRRDADVTGPAATASPPISTHGPAPIHRTANVAPWATAHVPTDTIIALLARAGITARVSPPAPAKALLFNATDLELVAVDDRAVAGFVIYRYRDVAAAASAYQLPLVHDPTRGTISWVATPRFVLMGDALVSYATDDEAAHERVARALVYPDLATVPPATCAEQRERTLGMTAIILRLDRAAAKRMTVADLEAAGLRVGPREADPNTFVCVVAVAGELRQPMGLLAVPNYPWGVFVSGAGGEPIGSTAMEHRGSWPPYFDALPNRVPNPSPGTVAELVDAMTVRVKLESPMLSQEFGSPVLLRIDRYTELRPSARDIGALGLTVGDRVFVFFQRERRDPADGAYLLSKLAIAPGAARPASDPVPRTPPDPPGVLLDLRLGPRDDQPGLSAASPGLTPRGPTSLAVDEQGRVYLWDQAKSRVLVYAGHTLVRQIPLPQDIPGAARQLEVLNGKLYLALLDDTGARSNEWELDAATGALLRTVPPAPGPRRSTLYPTARYVPTSSLAAPPPIGIDRYGNRYERFIDPTCSRGAAVCLEVRRFSPSGALLTHASEPAGADIADYYVARDGAVYELRNDRSGSALSGVFVVRLLSALPVPMHQVRLAGEVRDGDPGSPSVADAIVRLEPYGVEVRTDAAGRFVFPTVDVPAPCRWVTVSVAKAGFGAYSLEFALYSPDVGVFVRVSLERRDVSRHVGPPQAAANLGEAFCFR